MKIVLLLLALGGLLCVVTWAGVFGGIGAVLGPYRGRTRQRGFSMGFFLGPLGWLLLVVRPGAWRRGAVRVKDAAVGVVRGIAPKARGDDVSVNSYDPFDNNDRVLERARKVELNEPDLPIS
jgi:hypothetical protein